MQTTTNQTTRDLSEAAVDPKLPNILGKAPCGSGKTQAIAARVLFERVKTTYRSSEGDVDLLQPLLFPANTPRKHIVVLPMKEGALGMENSFWFTEAVTKNTAWARISAKFFSSAEYLEGDDQIKILYDSLEVMPAHSLCIHFLRLLHTHSMLCTPR